MKINTKKGLRVALILGIIVAPNLLFGAGYEEFLDKFEVFIESILKIFPLLVKLLLMFFAVTCLAIVPIGAYMLALRHFKKNDERNDSDASATTTHAKALAMAIMGFLMGMFLFQVVAIYGMGLDEAIGGGGTPASYGKILTAVLMLDYWLQNYKKRIKK